MCHLSRLTTDQQRTFDAMPLAYRKLLGDHIEEAPSGASNTRKLFDAWTARLVGVDNARAAATVTHDVITEAWEPVDPFRAKRRREDRDETLLSYSYR